ncbi:MAG: AbrB/MazE/SpoVT family DNA-binding domain-containing protein [Lentisphaerota bacterium]
MEVKIMNAGTVSFSSRGQIVIPSVFRKEFGIQTGTKAIVMSKDNAIIIRPITNESVKSSFGRHCGKNLLKVLEELKKTEREL